MDLPALPKCKRTKSGEHDIAVVVPGEDSGDLTFYCGACCIVRRVPASGPVLTPRLDDETAEVIAFAARIARES